MIPMLMLAAILGAGVVAGVFFAFSTFVMSALARLPAAQGIAAMQSVNVTVLNPWFMGIFLGTAAFAVLPALRWSEPGGAYRVAGAGVYLVGVLGVTMAFNVPRNEALALLSAESAEAAVVWPRYVAEWTLWNHVRGAAALGATALFTIALVKR